MNVLMLADGTADRITRRSFVSSTMTTEGSSVVPFLMTEGLDSEVDCDELKARRVKRRVAMQAQNVVLLDFGVTETAVVRDDL